MYSQINILLLKDGFLYEFEQASLTSLNQFRLRKKGIILLAKAALSNTVATRHRWLFKLKLQLIKLM